MAGDPVDLVVYEGAHHAFDFPALSDGSTAWYNADFHADAVDQFSAFLQATQSAP